MNLITKLKGKGKKEKLILVISPEDADDFEEIHIAHPNGEVDEVSILWAAEEEEAEDDGAEVAEVDE
jgi:hypothetical protein